MAKPFLRVGVVQFAPEFGRPEQNVARALALMEGEGADLFVLPELFATGYLFESADELRRLAEQPNGPTGEALRRFASRQNCYIAYGFAELGDPPYNSAALVGPQGIAALYRKIHLFDRELELFAEGTTGFPVVDLPIGRIGLMICYDWIYPEAARTLALRGAQLIAHPSNLVLPFCPDAMVTRCLENRVFAATANRVGTEARAGCTLTFIGQSQLAAPNGTILRRLDAREERCAVVEIDPALADDKTTTSRNHLWRQRRPDQYEV